MYTIASTNPTSFYTQMQVLFIKFLIENIKFLYKCPLFFSMKDVLRGVIANIKPSKEERAELLDKVNDFLKNVNTGLKDAKAILGGSGAKDTWLKGACDADIFVKFKYSVYKTRDDLSELLGKHIKKRFPSFKKLHGSRDYFQIIKKGFIFEVIPILDIKKAEQAKNITDVSPLHSR